jgi:hypothetical protein
MAEARIEVTCPGCEKPFHVPPAEQGKIAECPACGGWVDVPELGRPPTTAEMDDAAAQRTAREYDRQTAEGARLLAENARQIEQSQQALDHRDQQDARFDRLLDRMEVVIGQWEQLAARMGRVLDRLG